MHEDILFPHDELREIQSDMIQEIVNCLEKKKSLIAHAPTGLGKTAAALAPCLAYAIKHKKTVFFLTSRHTQHKIALETLKKIREKHQKDFIISDIIGKKHMCLQSGVETLYSGEFAEYCRKLREDGKCEFYSNTYTSGKLTVRARSMLNDLMVIGTYSSDEIVNQCRNSSEPQCPYEMSQQLAKEARVVIADYYYVFNPDIQESFFNKAGIKIEDSIIIVDEAHNLPERIRELMTSRLSLTMLDRAINEAKKLKYNEAMYLLNRIKEALQDIAASMNVNDEDKLISKEEFKKKIDDIDQYEKIKDDLEYVGDEIRKAQKRSYIASIAEFLKGWLGKDDGFIRYIKIDVERKDNIIMSYRCLDPSILTKDIADQAHSVIMMSGTLTPTSMYNDLIGFDKSRVIEREYESPFPKENRLALIIPETSTKFTARSEEQYKRIAQIAAEAADSIKGNVALFFPSYYLKDIILRYFKTLYSKSIFSEDPRMTSIDKHDLIERFKSYEKVGAALLAVASGSFGEGIDLPGDMLKGVIVVGLPLQKPDLETNELIKYYDVKFGKGWDYGYLFPAFNKTLQNAGRCIRTETDKGAIIFLDERYAWKNYIRCFPKDMNLKITKEYKAEIVEFFW